MYEADLGVKCATLNHKIRDVFLFNLFPTFNRQYIKTAIKYLM